MSTSWIQTFLYVTKINDGRGHVLLLMRVTLNLCTSVLFVQIWNCFYCPVKCMYSNTLEWWILLYSIHKDSIGLSSVRVVLRISLVGWLCKMHCRFSNHVIIFDTQVHLWSHDKVKTDSGIIACSLLFLAINVFALAAAWWSHAHVSGMPSPVCGSH